MLAVIKAAGIDVSVTSTSRSIHHQIALFAQGRVKDLVIVNHLRSLAGLDPISEKENKYTVTSCDGISKTSAHQDGRALDIVVIKNGKAIWDKKLAIAEYKKIGEIGKRNGFTWGGDWPPLDANSIGWDAFHFEMK